MKSPKHLLAVFALCTLCLSTGLVRSVSTWSVSTLDDVRSYVDGMG